MAQVTRVLGALNDDQCVVSYAFDDQTGICSLVEIVNDGPRGSVTCTLSDLATDAVVWTRTVTAKAGVQDFAVSVQLQAYTNKQGQPDWRIPYAVGLMWG